MSEYKEVKNNNNYNNWRGKFPFPKKKPFNPETFKVYRPYVGTGDTKAPEDVLRRMTILAQFLEQSGYTLRTGSMDGPDDVFEESVNRLELYVPWKNFKDKISKNYFNTEESMFIAKKHHKMWDALKSTIKAFLAKNVRMILGKNLVSRSIFIVLWTEDGVENSNNITSRTGNMSHIINVANYMKIPVYNMKDINAEKRIKNFLSLNN